MSKLTKITNKVKVQSLKKRWMRNSMSPIIMLVLIALMIFIAGISNYYFVSVKNGLEIKAKAAEEFIGMYSMGSYSDYYNMACEYTANFDDRDKLELQFINTSGRIEVSTYGVTVGLSPKTSDISEALSTGAAANFEGNDPNTGERIIAVSTPLEYNGMIVGVMRYVSSMHIIYNQVLISSGIAALLCLVVVMLVFVSNMTFIRNIVEPLAELTETAKLISGGSYGIQMENKYHDEIGELIDSINDMSQKISQNEKMQQEFISSVSHELRTPLTAITGWGETLLADIGSDSPQTRRGLGIMLKESRRLTNMVEELLEFSKMQDGRFTLRMEQVDIQAEFEDSIYTYRELFRQDGIEVNYTEGPELTPISGDSERLKQVFCNILDNAAKHGGSGKRIDASIEKEDGMVLIRVRDYGPGIPEAELPFVKQKFYKGSSKARGSGIGLAVADEIISRHGGRFEIGNAEGGGCVVSIFLPIE